MPIKVCGLTSPEDVKLACSSGSDFIGVVVEVERSPRSQRIADARRLFFTSDVPTVLVTCDKTLDVLVSFLHILSPSVIQLHGREEPELLAALKVKTSCQVWKALPLPKQQGRIGRAIYRRILTEAHRFLRAGCDAFILDAVTPKGFGGQGVTPPWELAAWLVERIDCPCLLAGGLTPENVTEAIFFVRPWGVDVSSGVEKAPGQKDSQKVRLFCARAQEAFQRLKS